MQEGATSLKNTRKSRQSWSDIIRLRGLHNNEQRWGLGFKVLRGVHGIVTPTDGVSVILKVKIAERLTSRDLDVSHDVKRNARTIAREKVTRTYLKIPDCCRSAINEE